MKRTTRRFVEWWMMMSPQSIAVLKLMTKLPRLCRCELEFWRLLFHFNVCIFNCCWWSFDNYNYISMTSWLCFVVFIYLRDWRFKFENVRIPLAHWMNNIEFASRRWTRKNIFSFCITMMMLCVCCINLFWFLIFFSHRTFVVVSTVNFNHISRFSDPPLFCCKLP